MNITENIIESVITTTQEASKAIIDIYKQGRSDFEVQIKSDESPLTKADIASHKIIVSKLTELTPEIPVLSEESAHVPFEDRQTWSSFWLVDPLDGTKEFIRRNDDFSINVALVENHEVVFGVVYLPVFNLCYWAVKGQGAYLRNEQGEDIRIHTNPCKSELKIVASRSHGSPKLMAFLEKLPQHQLMNRGSALKICMVAEGQADIYPRFGPTSEWDTAAAHIVLTEAGGVLLQMDNFKELNYNTKASLVNPEFIAIGDENYDWRSYF